MYVFTSTHVRINACIHTDVSIHNHLYEHTLTHMYVGIYMSFCRYTTHTWIYFSQSMFYVASCKYNCSAISYTCVYISMYSRFFVNSYFSFWSLLSHSSFVPPVSQYPNVIREIILVQCVSRFFDHFMLDDVSTTEKMYPCFMSVTCRTWEFDMFVRRAVKLAIFHHAHVTESSQHPTVAAML